MENNVLELICESLTTRIDKINEDCTDVLAIKEKLAKENVDLRHKIEKMEKESEQKMNGINKINDENKRQNMLTHISDNINNFLIGYTEFLTCKIDYLIFKLA